MTKRIEVSRVKSALQKKFNCKANILYFIHEFVFEVDKELDENELDEFLCNTGLSYLIDGPSLFSIYR